MYKACQELFSHAVVASWDSATADAERQIEEAEQRIQKLRGSIQTFRDMRDSGEPSPGEDKALGSESA